MNKNTNLTDLLESGQVFTGGGEDVSTHSAIAIFIYSDVASATDGLQIQFSPNGPNWSTIETHTIQAGVVFSRIIPVKTKYFRLIYTNGSANQSEFLLRSLYESSTATAISTGTSASDLGKAVDSVAGATDTGVAILAVRDDSLSTLTPADGDYSYLRVGSTGALHTSVSTALPAGDNNIGNVDVASVVPGTSASDLGKAVDSVAGATDTGVAILAVRDDSLTTLTPADGDYSYLRVGSTGALHTQISGNNDNSVSNLARVSSANAMYVSIREPLTVFGEVSVAQRTP